ncbi:DUF6458 family protein [Polymorphospora rubra]|uniref:DUF6458 domain-containing protein n=1 Tax=Polymorphospora rubra TaxID=338584 RepID=A0A810MZK1_9ACTN|nr:DUF6458 family protein [Polymorphospora rubra]BCJ65389.1 hypothetical protein Prubr_24100 [Polymorphospora rubra]
MGIGGGIFLISLGAILAFAIRADVWWIDIRAVGWVLILSGVTMITVTLWYWADRRRRTRRLIVEENRLSHSTSIHQAPAELPSASPPPANPLPPEKK